MVTLALYAKPGNWVNRIVRWRTHSPYTHCELVVDGLAYSASARDGGVRVKRIAFDDGWDLIDLPWAAEQRVRDLFGDTEGCGYDWLAVFIGRALDGPTNSKRRYFCSEWCAEALGFSEPWRFTPADLAAFAQAWSAPHPLAPETV